MNQLKQLWNQLRGSFWFLPSLLVAMSITIALALIQVDSAASQHWMSHWPRLFGASAEGARGVLSTIAGSMMTVVGVTFSMVLVTLAQVSSQYTSRILRNFMRDRVTQVVLGIFSGIFTYCLIVLRTIRGGDEAGFIPSVAVNVGVLLAIGGIGVLIYFIHHIAASIQASSIIASVANETIAAIDRLFPAEIGQASEGDTENHLSPLLPEQNWQAVPARGSGYIQSVDNETLLHLAQEHQTIVRMELGIGDFVVKNTTLASLALEVPPQPELIAALQSAYNIHRYRTVEQDPAFGIRQLVDMALRALSPGINDTTTAVMCVDYLTAILARLAVRTIPSSHRYDEGQLRVIAIGQTFASLVSESFDQIRGSAGGNVAILLRILDAFHTISGVAASRTCLQVLREQTECIAEVAARTIRSPHDRAFFENRLTQLRKELRTASP
ncbi:MAG: DUF2254 domain-containing protein [Halioglobus sp.]